MDRRIKLFIKHLRKSCDEHQVDLLLEEGESVSYGGSMGCTGYFSDGDDDSSPTLACAIGDMSNIYVSTLVHESCHMDQWLEKAPIWSANHSCGVLDLWLDGTQVSNIKKHIAAVRDLELDCEKRTVKKILEYDLPINIKEYIQKANAYVQFYNYIGQTRKWSNQTNSPYGIKEIWSNLPTTFRQKNYYDELPNKVSKLFIKHGVCL